MVFVAEIDRYSTSGGRGSVDFLNPKNSSHNSFQIQVAGPDVAGDCLADFTLTPGTSGQDAVIASITAQAMNAPSARAK